jgi:hypothetical protein
VGTAADDYEKRYMAADGALARSRARMPRWFNVLVLGLAGTLTLQLLLGAVVLLDSWHTYGWGPMHALLLAALAIGALALAVTVAFWTTTMVVRVTVTPQHVHIQHGLFGPTIPLEEIEETWIENNDWRKWLRYVGWGFGGKGFDGSNGYTVLGAPRGLAIRFRHGGRSRVAFVSSEDPESLRASIEQARRRPRVLVEQAEAVAHEALEEEEPLLAAPERMQQRL